MRFVKSLNFLKGRKNLDFNSSKFIIYRHIASKPISVSEFIKILALFYIMYYFFGVVFLKNKNIIIDYFDMNFIGSFIMFLSAIFLMYILFVFGYIDKFVNNFFACNFIEEALDKNDTLKDYFNFNVVQTGAANEN